MSLGLLHRHDGMRLNPNENHAVVDEADRRIALDLISVKEKQIKELQRQLAEAQARIRDLESEVVKQCDLTIGELDRNGKIEQQLAEAQARIKELEKWLQESKDNYTRAMTESDKKVADMAVALNNALAHIRGMESEARS